MIVYEVNLEVNETIFKEYINWLKPHINELLAIEGFIKADLLFDRFNETKEVRKITVAYYLTDYAAYDNYVNNYAAKLREDALRRFNGQFNSSRRVLELEGTYSL
ncbi:DUF4286 family protein [Legionella hackeliae]|uniref:DUF4286 domain-containing protein n=1 Tax=Legionella hackeliae TaxID=449 RepID=A0A0A8URI4_LEGHA|nr:DUF4286 family protein [Legionella hackeliae]KTD15274.1 hypothetical protein Lhac_0116 [Legionella hackeliae]CEK11358.1 conserved protein of unknown function [Legionella hackeliae]STX48130.1 Uncharacterised protein [Legionella hackeliae]